MFYSTRVTFHYQLCLLFCSAFFLFPAGHIPLPRPLLGEFSSEFSMRLAWLAKLITWVLKDFPAT